jgi:hypothetical protein
VPLYAADCSFIDLINERRALRLESAGLATVIRNQGHLKRVVLLRRAGDPRPTSVRDYRGQSYSFEQPLSDGHFCWRFRPLQGGRSETMLAPPEVRPIFLRVLLDCMVGA